MVHVSLSYYCRHDDIKFLCLPRMVHVSISLSYCRHDDIKFLCLPRMVHVSLSLYCRHDDIKFLCLPRMVHVSLSDDIIIDMTTLSFSVYLV